MESENSTDFHTKISVNFCEKQIFRICTFAFMNQSVR